MKRIILFILLTIASTRFLSAQIAVTIEESRRAAVNYAQRHLQYHTLDETRIDTVVEFRSGPDLRMREVVFDNKLSVVLSAWKNCPPILMYTTEGGRLLSDTVSIPEGLKYFIRGYSFSIGYMVDSIRRQEEHPQWAELLDTLEDATYSPNTVYGPLLSTRWGQEGANFGSCEAYNHYVEETNDSCQCSNIYGRKCPAGCVATAMAQIMNYWKYPIFRPNRMEPYDWCNMPDELRINYISGGVIVENLNFENERNAIARLMKDCGDAADMDYCFSRKCQSYSTPQKARNALVNTFGYHPDAVRRLRSSYSTNNWKAMVIRNITSGMPVLYAGVSLPTTQYDWNGHAFVCDGYNSATDMFHFNFGHLGVGNAWCTIDSIIEGSYNWNHLERAVFNIYPGTAQDYCNFILPLEQYYDDYYNTHGNSSPISYNNVPHAAAVLLSSANNSVFPSSWHVIPSGASSEYAAHKEVVLRDGFVATQGSDFHAYITPCASCDDTSSRMMPAHVSNNKSQLYEDGTKESRNPQTLKAGIIVYPNPAYTKITVHSEQGTVDKVQVYDVYGKLLKTVEAGDNIVELDVSELASGMYFVRVSTDKGVVTKSFVKK